MPIYKTKEKDKTGQTKYKVRINYIDRLGNAKQLTRVAYGYQNAKMLELKLQTENKEPTTSMTFEELYILFINAKKYEVRETTLERLETCFRIHILPYFETTKINKIKLANINDWKNYILDKGLATRTNQHAFSDLRTFFNWATKNAYISESPIMLAENFKNAYETSKQDKIRYYTADEFKQYIEVAHADAATKDDYRYYTFFMIAYFTGMRKGEINALTWADFKDDKLSVKRSIAQKLKGEDRITPPKNKSSYRAIQCPKPLLEVLEQQKKRQSLSSAFTKDNLICGFDKALRDTTLDKKNRAFAKMADLPRITIHEFRHSHATLLANNGINIQEIARRLGHSDVQETWNTYSHLYPKEEERAIEILNNI